LVGPNWLEKLLAGFDPKVSGYEQVAAVGPVSNFAGGIQGKPGITFENFLTYQGTGFSLASVLSGFCMLLDREKAGGELYFDERFENGFEDTDLSIRLLNKGLNCIVDNRTAVYHHGSKTLKRENIDVFNNYKLFLEKHKPTERQTLAVIYRAKVMNTSQLLLFRQSLDSCSEFADYILVLDDNSRVDYKLEKQIKKLKWFKRYRREFDERRDRNELIQAAKDLGANWILSLDIDELLEPKATKELITRLINPPSPLVRAYAFTWANFWNSPEYVRTDGIFGSQAGVRLVKITSGTPLITLGDSQGMHCGNVPQYPIDSVRPTSIQILHYGYLSEEERYRKYEFYEKTDKEKRPDLIGAQDYYHIIDETNLRLAKWVPDNTITLCCLADRETQLFRFLDAYSSFFDEIVINTRKQRELEFLAEVYHASLISTSLNDFSLARNKMIEASTKKWCFHIDPDESFDPLSIRRMLNTVHIDGFLFYIDNIMKDGQYSVSESLRLFRRDKPFYYTGYVHETLDESCTKYNLKIYRASSRIRHFGYLEGKSTIAEKWKRYMELNVRQLKDCPNDPRAYFHLALHFRASNELDLAERLLHRACQLSDKFFNPRLELSLLYLTRAKSLLEELLQILPSTHERRNQITQLLKLIYNLDSKHEFAEPDLREIFPNYEEVKNDIIRCLEARSS
jgi:hypothetical protein